MLTNISVENFKCFEKKSFPIRKLNLFTGFNASGKSSLIQSILLGGEVIEYNNLPYLKLNGCSIKLGSVGDVIFRNSKTREIKFSYEIDGEEFKLELNASERGKSLLPVVSDRDAANIINNKLKDIIYLSASRIGCLDVYPIPDNSEYNGVNVGDCGQFAPWLFNQHADSEINPLKIHDNEKSLNFRRQFLAWINDIFPDAEANTEIIEKTPLVRLELRKSKTEDWNRPINIGFGFSYAFPILVAGLLAKENQILIIDSPEAHLHPQAQSKIGQFLSKMASAGVQIIIETHSDHVLDGVRISTSKKTISSDQVNILFFTNKKDNDVKKPEIFNLSINPDGRLNEWPKGFFDQSEVDLMVLNGWGK